MDNLAESCAPELESLCVRQTYDNIADDFSQTRYKKWPKVAEFLTGLRNGSLLLDVGCGNGKYLDNPDTFNIGCDISVELLKICRSKGFEVVLCDMTHLPFREDVYDSIICIASIHHIVGEARRQACLEKMIKLLPINDSRMLVQAWSFEQNISRDNPYLTKKHTEHESDSSNENREIILYNGEVVTLPVHKNRTPFRFQDVLVPFHVKNSPSIDESRPQLNKITSVQYRYYHVFKENELDSMFKKIPDVNVIHSYYDRGNWCTIVERSSLPDK